MAPRRENLFGDQVEPFLEEDHLLPEMQEFRHPQAFLEANLLVKLLSVT